MQKTFMKQNKLPSIPGLTDRPRTVRSGRRLKERVTICYRSDLYLNELKRHVISFQEQLQSALNDLKHAKPESISYHTQRVQLMKEKTDNLVMVLQVCGKINRELAYARKDLLNSVENGASSKVINKRRKRVQWLENRLEDIIIKNSPNNKDDEEPDIDMQSPARLSAIEDGSPVPKSRMSSVLADGSRLQTAESVDRLNTAGTNTSVLQRISEAFQENQVIGASEFSNRLVLMDQLHQTDGATLRVQNKVLTKSAKANSRLSFRDPIEDEAPTAADDKISSNYDDKDDNSSDYEEDDAEDQSENDESGAKSRMSAVSSLFTDVTDEGARHTRLTKSSTDQSAKRSYQQQTTKHVQGVSSSSEEAEIQQIVRDSHAEKTPAYSDRLSLSSMSLPISEVFSDPRDDAAAEYWHSEHHRMEFSELKPFINELDPNSLHQVGIAVPGNYVKKLDRPKQLPWRELEDNNDVNREALDRLSTQLVEMQERVYEAARKSVELSNSRLLTGASGRNFSSVAKAVGRSAMVSRELTQMSNAKTVPGTAALAQISEAEELPPLYTPIGHMQFHSKEIPPAAALPLSRVNRNKCYPRLITSFVFPDPDGRPAPDRLIDQGRLYNDTKLVIYKSPFKKRKGGNAERKDDNNVMQSEPQLKTPTTKSSKLPLSMKSAGQFALAVDEFASPFLTYDNEFNYDHHPSTTSTEDTTVASSGENGTADISSGKKSPVNRQSPMPTMTLSPPKTVNQQRPYHTGLKWERVKYLFEHSLKSEVADERIEAAKQIGLLKCTDPAVFHALKIAIVEDTEERVQYEATKSLIELGCLDNELIQILVDYLIVGNEEIRLDMLKCICGAKDIAFINKSMPAFEELVKVLSHLCKEPNHEDLVSFEAAITFGKICVKNSQAVLKMSLFLDSSEDTHKKATALRILIKQFNESGLKLVDAVIKQFTSSPVWDYRIEAAKLLQHLGRKHTCQVPERENLLFEVLEKKLWDDPVELVRLESARTLITLNMYARAAESVIKSLADNNATKRAHAVTSLGTLGIKQPKVLRHLSEMLELDPSDTVRREVIRTLGSLQVTDKNIIRLLKERERGGGVLALEAKKVLQTLEQG